MEMVEVVATKQFPMASTAHDVAVKWALWSVISATG
jgi:hypothetical protein